MTEGRIDNDGWFLAKLLRPLGFDRALGIIFLVIMFRVIFEFISNALQNSSNCDHARHTFYGRVRFSGIRTDQCGKG